MTDCLFCKIIAGEIPSDIVYRDDEMLVFKDIAPKAPVHLLAIPLRHIENLDDLDGDAQALLGRMLGKVSKIAHDAGLAEGYRVITNTNAGGGQEVYHLHFHILGDVRQATWAGM
ncbi:histidine triad nucleotide-binding protein [Salinibius halmophilus]|uniref:histidine triad nucleotide-binding protein n=1 Tax=Salinibius halmophilus TaxID=1853216 RepID=UPI000E65EBAF|nr:histidine triad nucleotide-binding protein [Salinibius halmophilus]